MKEDELWLAALMTSDFRSLSEVLSKFLDDNLREKLVKDMVRMSMDDVILDGYERRTLDLIARMDSKRIDREEGINEGIEQGINLTIVFMLQNNIDY